MRDLPTGTVTLLLTDIEGSTQLLHAMGDRYAEVLAAHRDMLREAFTDHEGYEVDTQGDAFFVAFPSATKALASVVQAQRALFNYPWPDRGTVRVRMGLHTGEPARTEEGYVGMDVHEAARICSAGHGGQILLSKRTAEAVEAELCEGLTLRDLGQHQLKDIEGLQRLYQVVIPELPSDFSELRSLDTSPNNLPTPPTPFIGRAREVATVRDLLRRDDVREVTLTGPGGTGKSRLALRVATELLHDFDDGAFYVPLAPIRDPDLVVSAIAQTLGVREGAGRPLIESLKDHLRTQELLLILDNFEQVLPAARALADIMTSCPRIKVLVTSRQVLRLSAEYDVPVPPMGMPDRDALPPVSELGQFEAIRLFVERAQSAKIDFKLEDSNASPVVEICHRLDGLPLAIELAAARVRSIPIPELLDQLEHRLSVLTDGPIDLPERQQTLRDAIAWSYDLLEPDEQKLCRRLAVFVGGFTDEAAEAVCRADGDLELTVLDGTGSLIDKSLLSQQLGPGGPNKVLASPESSDTGRFTMLETIREYCLEQLEASEETAAVRARHQAWCVKFAEHAAPQLRGSEQSTWLDRLEREHGNLRSSLGWGLEGGGDIANAPLRLGAALWLFWYEHGHLSEGRQWLQQALDADPDSPAQIRAGALSGAAELARHQASYDQAIELAEAAHALYRKLEDKAGIARTLSQLGVMAQFQGDSSRAFSLLEESLALSREVRDSERTAYTLMSLGSISLLRDELARAEELYEECLLIYRELGEKSSIATAIMNLGEVAQLQGDNQRAASLYRETMSLYHELQFKAAMAYCLENLAGLAADEGNCERAAQLFGAAEALRELVGAPVESYNLERYERQVAAARSGLADEVFNKAWTGGRQLSLESTVAYAIEADGAD